MSRLEGFFLASVFIGTFLADFDPPTLYLGYTFLAVGVVLAVPTAARYSLKNRLWAMLALAAGGIGLAWMGEYGFAVFCFLTGFVPWVYHVIQRKHHQGGEPKTRGERTT